MSGKSITQSLHTTLYKVFAVRPAKGSEDPFNTQAEFGLYDELHDDYVYQDAWVSFLTHFMQITDLDAAQLRQKERNGEQLVVDEHRV